MCLSPYFVNYKFDKEFNKYELDWKSCGTIRSPLDKAFKFKCGRCVECMNDQSTAWAVRCFLESKHHKKNCIITMTYNERWNDGELHKRDYQLFLKRLRKAIAPAEIKYFVSGEYGSLYGRPHYHIIIFGWCPDDLRPYKRSKKGTLLYNSSFVDSLWTARVCNEDGEYVYDSDGSPCMENMGFCTIDADVSFSSCFYSAKYLQKLVSKLGVPHIQDPFVCMSKGIGLEDAIAFDPTKEEYFYISGKRYRAPRYFYKKYRELKGELSWEFYTAFRDAAFQTIDILNLPVYPFTSIERRRELQKKKNDIERSNSAKEYIFEKKFHIKC